MSSDLPVVPLEQRLLTRAIQATQLWFLQLWGWYYFLPIIGQTKTLHWAPNSLTTGLWHHDVVKPFKFSLYCGLLHNDKHMWQLTLIRDGSSFQNSTLGMTSAPWAFLTYLRNKTPPIRYTSRITKNLGEEKITYINLHTIH